MLCKSMEFSRNFEILFKKRVKNSTKEEQFRKQFQKKKLG